MKSIALAILVTLSAAAAAVPASADTFTVHGTFGGNSYGGR